jgi:hypothetical protein
MGTSFNNSGLVDVESGTLNIGGTITNSGTFNAASNAVVQFQSVPSDFVPSKFRSGSAFLGPGLKRFASGNYQLDGSITAQNVELAGGNLTGKFTLTEGPVLWTGGAFGGGGIGSAVGTASNVVLVISGTNDVRLGGFFTNNGTAFWMGSGRLLLTYGTFVNAGTFVVRSNMTVAPYAADGQLFNSGLFINEGGSNTMTFGPYIPFYNSGIVDVGVGNFTFSVAGGFRGLTQTAGLLRLAGGNVLGAVSIQGGTLSGYGTITGGVINGGAVAPGDPIGALTIVGTYTQTGELDLDLGGRAPGVDYDQLIVTGRASLRGVLRVALDNGFMPALGDNFSVLSFGSRVGRFDCLIGANLGGGTKLLANYSPTNVLLTTTNGPVQTNTMTIFTCGAHPPHLQFTGLPGQTYSIEATTNIVTVTNCVPDPCQILSRFDNWVTLFRTNSPTGEIDFDDPDAASLDHRFYRARLEP